MEHILTYWNKHASDKYIEHRLYKNVFKSKWKMDYWNIHENNKCMKTFKCKYSQNSNTKTVLVIRHKIKSLKEQCKNKKIIDFKEKQ